MYVAWHTTSEYADNTTIKAAWTSEAGGEFVILKHFILLFENMQMF